MIVAASRGPARLLVIAALAGTALACSGRDEPDRRETNPATGEQLDRDQVPAEIDPAGEEAAGPAPRAGDEAPAAPPRGFHLDEPEVEYEPARREGRPRRGKPIELVLRSTPPGAVAAVDGVAVGPTPALWEGTADGRARDFTFVLPGHSIARYKFVPTQSGVVHGTLTRLKSTPDGEERDGRAAAATRP